MIGAIATIGVASITVLGVLIGHTLHRVRQLEDSLEEERAYTRKLWWYTRGLLDQYYRWRRDGAPDPDQLPERKP